MNLKKIVSAASALTIAASAFASMAVVGHAADGDPITLKAAASGTVNGNNGYVKDEPSFIVLNGAAQTSAWGSDGLVSFAMPTIPTGYKINTATLDVYLYKEAQDRESDRAVTVLGMGQYVEPANMTTVPELGTTVNCGTVTKHLTKKYQNNGEKFGTWTVTDYVKQQIDAVSEENASFIEFYLDAVFTGTAKDAHGTYVYGADEAQYAPTLTLTLIEASTPTYKVTTNYVDEDGKTVENSAVKEGVTAGTSFTPEYKTTIYKDDGYKYTYKEGAGTTTINKDTTINVVYSKQEIPKYTQTLKAKYGDNEAVEIGSIDVAENGWGSIPYSKYVEYNGSWYSINREQFASKEYYRWSISKPTAAETKTANYTAVEDTVVHFVEGETIFTDNNVTSADIRCSMGKGGDVVEKTTITTLPAGTYQITSAAWGGGTKEGNNSTYTFYYGDKIAGTITTTGSLVESTTNAFTITSDTVISVDKTVVGSKGACLDYVLIKTNVAPTFDISDLDTFETENDPDCTAFKLTVHPGTYTVTGIQFEDDSKAVYNTTITGGDAVIGVIYQNKTTDAPNVKLNSQSID